MQAIMTTLRQHGETQRSGAFVKRIASGSVFVTILLTGLIAGFFYAWACSVMPGLANTDDRTFVQAMQEINAIIRNAWFAPAFFGSLIGPVIVAGMMAKTGQRPGMWWALAAFVFYTLAFGITMAINVPMNNDLAAAGPVDSISNLASVRADFEDRWVRWNIVRAIASTLALGCLIRTAMIRQK